MKWSSLKGDENSLLMSWHRKHVLWDIKWSSLKRGRKPFVFVNKVSIDITCDMKWSSLKGDENCSMSVVFANNACDMKWSSLKGDENIIRSKSSLSKIMLDMKWSSLKGDGNCSSSKYWWNQSNGYEMILVKRGRKQLDIHDDVVGMLGYEMILD